MSKIVDTRYQSKHATLAAARLIGAEQSKKKHGVAFGIIEDKKENVFYVEEDYTDLRNFERFHGEYLNGQYFNPDE
jgi:hypothetical protein